MIGLKYLYINLQRWCMRVRKTFFNWFFCILNCKHFMEVKKKKKSLFFSLSFYLLFQFLESTTVYLNWPRCISQTQMNGKGGGKMTTSVWGHTLNKKWCTQVDFRSGDGTDLFCGTIYRQPISSYGKHCPKIPSLVFDCSTEND